MKYRAIREAKDWKNPYLIVQPDGIEIVGVTTPGHPIAVDSVRGALEALADSAWPYGLVVAVQDAGITSSMQVAPQIRRNQAKLVNTLRKLGVTVEFWPSA